MLGSGVEYCLSKLIVYFSLFRRLGKYEILHRLAKRGYSHPNPIFILRFQFLVSWLFSLSFLTLFLGFLFVVLRGMSV